MTHRRILPHRRASETFDLRHGDKNTTFKVSIGYDPGGAPAEVFVTGAKAGSEVEAVARDGAVLLSLALQYGVPLDVMAGAITRDASGQPSTVIGAVLDRLLQQLGGAYQP